MSDFMVMQPSNTSFQELMGNGVIYHIPKFQRDYSWQQEHWEDLWDDIEKLDRNNPHHYLGYIVLQQKKVSDTFYLLKTPSVFQSTSLMS